MDTGKCRRGAVTDWRTQLRAADRERGASSSQDVERVRHAVIASARHIAPAPGRFWRPAFALAAMVLVVIAGVTTARQAGAPKTFVPPATDAGIAPVPASGPAPVERQQLQFATPGGTRIIWVFDSSFELEGSVP